MPFRHASWPTSPLDFHPSIRNARLVHAAVHGLVRRCADDHRKADELIAAIPPLVAQYELTARLVGRTPEAIEFSVTRQ